jgi:hypothetical protein
MVLQILVRCIRPDRVIEIDLAEVYGLQSLVADLLYHLEGVLAVT